MKGGGYCKSVIITIEGKYYILLEPASPMCPEIGDLLCFQEEWKETGNGIFVSEWTLKTDYDNANQEIWDREHPELKSNN